MKNIINHNAQMQADTLVEQTSSILYKQGEVYQIDPATAEIELHELAAAFPRLEGEAYSLLKNSIAADGQQVPILMYGNILLDGRNRFNVCFELGIPARAVQWNGTGTPEELIIALNLHRRHLTASQRAALAVAAASFRAGGC